MPKLDGRTALVTGGNSGIGLATAKALAKEGAQVYITGRRQRELATAVEEIGSNAVGVLGDVSNLGDLDRLFEQIRREKGRLDILCECWDRKVRRARRNHRGTLRFDFRHQRQGVLFTVQKALPLMPDGASIILNASVVASKGLSSNSVYSATKAAIRSFARTWTTDLKNRRIRVNAISPGTIETPGLNDLLASGEAGEQRRKMIASAIPLGRFGQPDEVAKAVVFLASDDSSYITVLNCSWTAALPKFKC